MKAIYKRDIGLRLLLVRLLFLALLLFCIHLFKEGIEDYASVIIILLLLASIFQVTDLDIYENTLEVRRYFLFGFFRHKIVFEKHLAVSLTSFNIELHDPATWADMESLSDDVAISKMFTITQEDEIGNVKQVRLKLSNHEFKLIKTLTSN